MSKKEYSLQSLAWASVFAAGTHFVHPLATGSDIQNRLGMGLSWLRDTYLFAIAFGVGMTFLMSRLEPLVASALEGYRDRGEEQKYHKERRRFARLLVAEIDLYNKGEVEEGRKNKDIYIRLKSDIERSRLTFQKRFSKPVTPRIDYFHEELIRTLANNDDSVMGPDYPGPTV